MEVSVENMSSLGRRLKVSVPESQVNDQCKSKMAELAKQVRIKGFRPGKVPANILQQRFGRSVRAEVIGEVIEKSLTDALKNNELRPAGTPKIEDIKDEDGQPLEYVAEFEVYPEIELAPLAEVEIEKKVVEISDADIQDTMDKMADNLAHWHSVERPAKEGDKLDVDLERLSVEGIDEEKPQSYKHVDFVLDTKKSLPGLVQELIGKEAKFEGTFEVPYPEEWHDKKLAGKHAQFKVTIHGVNEKHAMTQEQLAEHFDLEKDDIDGLKAKVKERMEKEAEKVLREDIKERVLEVLLDKNQIEKPQSLIDQERAALLREMEHKQKGGMLDEDLSEDDIKELTEKRVVLGLLVNEVIAKHQIKVNNQRVREVIAEQAANFPDPKTFISYYYNNKELLQGVERIVLLDQAVDTLLGEMKVKDKPVSFDEVMNPPAEEEENKK